MNQPPFELDKGHRWFAIEANNRAWDLLAKEDRSAQETEEMVHVAHASLYHWSKVGSDLNKIRGLTLVANACAAAGLGDSALRCAESSWALLEVNRSEVADWDVAFGFDCLARAADACGDAAASADYASQAAVAGADIKEEGDREVFDEWFQSCPNRD